MKQIEQFNAKMYFLPQNISICYEKVMLKCALDYMDYSVWMDVCYSGIKDC